MKRFRLLALSVAVSLMVALIPLVPNSTHAGTSAVTVAKRMFNLDAVIGQNNGAFLSSRATVYKSNQTVQIAITVSNNTPFAQTVTIIDFYNDGTFGFSGAPIFDAAEGWYLVDPKVNTPGSGGAKQGSVSNTCPVNCPVGVGAVRSVSPSIAAGKVLEMRYKIKAAWPADFPTYKTRLESFPVQANISGLNGVVDVAYLLVTPAVDHQQNTTSSVFSRTNNNVDEYDFLTIVPGVAVDIVGSGTNTVRTPDIPFLAPRQGSDTANAIRSCKGSNGGVVMLQNRGGSCLFSTEARVSVDQGGGVFAEQGGALAQLMVEPTSSVIGGVFVGSPGSDVTKVLLPGQHTASSGLTGSTAASSVGYAIGANSVSGWDSSNTAATQIYRNVFLNANVDRLKKTPDWALDIISAAQVGKFGNANMTVACVSNCVAGGGTPRFLITGVNNAKLDLSTSTLVPAAGNQGITKPTNPRSSGYVLYVKGDLDISGPITHLGGGTIIVDGRLQFINNASVTPPPNSTNSPLGFIAGSATNPGPACANQGGANSCIVWDASSSSTLDSIAFFTPYNFYARTSNASTQYTLTGSIVAQQVDLSGILAPSDPNGLSIQVVYDQKLSANPPPGFSVFAPGSALNEGGP